MSGTGSGAGPHRSSSGRTCRTCCAAPRTTSIRRPRRPGPRGSRPCRPAQGRRAMPDVSFTNLLVVMAVAVLAPLIVGYLPRLRVPAVVLEIVGGIIIGPSVLGWVHVDLPVSILALFGLAFLLFLAGLEIDVHRLRGRLLRYAVLGYLVSLVLAYGAGASFTAIGWVSQPLLLAIVLC